MDVQKIREDFPFVRKGVYFDNACQSLRPKQVIDKVSEYYNEYPGCGGRSAHKISQRVSDEVANARKLVRKFINARKDEEIIFTRNTTEGINLVSKSFDSVLISDREHNSNLIPWLAFKKKLVVVNSTKDEMFDLDDFEKKVKDVELVSVVWTSNLDGYSLPVKEIIKIAHKNGAKVLLDGAQAVPHFPVDVKKLDCDFLCFSGHKACGPSGIGVLYGKRDELEMLKPFIVGGDTVYDSSYVDFKLEKIPKKFEAGLQDYAGIVGLGEAVRYLSNIGMKNIEKHCHDFGKQLFDGVSDIGKVEIVGVKDYSFGSSIVNFNVKGANCHDVAMLLDQNFNIMVRSGAHCMHSWFNKHNIQGSVRASLYFYNNGEEVDKFVSSLKKVVSVLGK